MSQHWKSLLVVVVIIGAIVFFYRGDKKEAEQSHPQENHINVVTAPEAPAVTPEQAAPQSEQPSDVAAQSNTETVSQPVIVVHHNQ